ncbi:MAG TPA: DUF6152 family protein [Steroidobacteraceae bacterium]|nr:DUF6152 family protein [Steroidobacteraceae bacterium]
MKAPRFANIRALAAQRLMQLSLLLLLAPLGTAQAHHTYAMFNRSQTLTLQGTVAKLEWTNPHVFLWLYVPSASNPGKYDLYALENGSPNAISKIGWNKESLQPGDKVTIEYWPLRDGRKGGHLAKATLATGRVLGAVGGPSAKANLLVH